jgi:hypothetical protein
MSATPDNTLANPEQVVCNLSLPGVRLKLPSAKPSLDKAQPKLDGRTVERDEALAREAAMVEVMQVTTARPAISHLYSTRYWRKRLGSARLFTGISGVVTAKFFTPWLLMATRGSHNGSHNSGRSVRAHPTAFTALAALRLRKLLWRTVAPPPAGTGPGVEVPIVVVRWFLNADRANKCRDAFYQR